MNQSRWRAFLVGALGAGMVLGLFVLAPSIGAGTGKPVDSLDSKSRASVDLLHQMSDGFATVAGLVTPSVVTITTEGETVPAGQRQIPQIFNDPRFREFFGDMFQTPPRTFRGLGSGVIVRSDGYILTNNHVVRGASELTVILGDERRLPATLVGADERSDLAVLKVDSDDLPAVTFGNSDDLRIGEWVLAVGSPFSENLSTSVTTGIVSAQGRNGVGLNIYEDYIQTDAAINPGNSGGALVNLNGEVVGINTGIASRGGGSNGIGFSIPANMARSVMNDLIDKGKVTRGWLGVTIGDLDEDLAEAFGLPDTRGVLVRRVLPGSPAYDAGLKDGDVITEIDGKPMRGTQELMLNVASSSPGTAVDLKVLREGDARRLVVELGQYPDEIAETGAPDPVESAVGELGLTVEPISRDLERRFDLQTVDGLVVTGVAMGSPAAEKGMRPGDVILEVNRRPVASIRDYREALSGTPEDKPVLFQMQRGEVKQYVAVRPVK